jgi:hypothetical protein
MRSNLRDAALIGAVSGLLFYVNAMLPGSYLYPLVWPLMGGATVVYVGSRAAMGTRGWGEAMLLAGVVGIIAGVFFLVPGIETLGAISRASSDSFPPFGGRGSLDRIQVVNSAIFAFVPIPAAALAGGALVQTVIRHLGRRDSEYHAQPA